VSAHVSASAAAAAADAVSATGARAADRAPIAVPAAGSDGGSAAGPDAAQHAGPDPAPAAPAGPVPMGRRSGPGLNPSGGGPLCAPGADSAAGPRTPEQDFDGLYAFAAPALVRQTYLLTGRRHLARCAVERAFRLAWDRWPEVATDPDPVGWVRAAAYDWALSPWHRFHRRPRKHPDKTPADPADLILMDALLALPPRRRRTVLLYDGVGLDLPDTAAETEASTPVAGGRLVRAHAFLAARVPELAAVPPGERPELLHDRLGALVPAVRLEPRAAASVRLTGEHRNRRLTRAAVGLTAVIAVATTYTAFTAPTGYVAPQAPGTSVSGVPPHAGPPPLTVEGRELQQKLRTGPVAGPARLVPRVE
ncbi:hypothetical protein, partial [Streptomyces bambusae]